ncbi:MAG TPA: PLD nuclease N-terminal domain-containing protein [Segeticoccus sp.]|jgi:hypothetical protein|nr:PLD nuclease N-terminal domain-containing protein [Segeticoccus sp.]
MLRVLVPLALLALTIYALVDCIQTEEGDHQHLSKMLWILIILFFPPVGPIAWLIAGRPNRPRPRSGPPPDHWGRTPKGPDDDPDFLRGL